MIPDEIARELGQRDNRADKQRLDAKIATFAMFLFKEAKARQTGLKSYKQFVTRIFGGEPWREARKTDSQVLTFNYDRLFEIACLESFEDLRDPNCSCYGKDALNSGFFPYVDGGRLVAPALDQFCFLKLHGSAGWWVKPEIGGEARKYWFSDPQKAMTLDEIEKSISKQRDAYFGWQPLIAFPYERQKSRQHFRDKRKSSGYKWAPYIDLVWESAATLIAAATEVRVVGYSFHPIDSRPMVDELLTQAKCEKIVIQNTTDVRANLESYKVLRGRLDYDPTPF
jgi:hypothetical protein